MLHDFSDASQRAYSATIYLVTGEGAQTNSMLMIAKPRVSPVKVVSLPKLELCGAQFLTQLISLILPRLSSQPSTIHCWTDSQVVLALLSGHPSRWKPFVANRVSEILVILPSTGDTSGLLTTQQTASSAATIQSSCKTQRSGGKGRRGSS